MFLFTSLVAAAKFPFIRVAVSALPVTFPVKVALLFVSITIIFFDDPLPCAGTHNPLLPVVDAAEYNYILPAPLYTLREFSLVVFPSTPIFNTPAVIHIRAEASQLLILG